MDRFISVDIEASGPVPGEFSMLSLGACVVGKTGEPFYVELKPITRKQDAEAMRVNGFNHDDLQQRGTDPVQAMLAFESWIHHATPDGYRPVFVGYPATFDWMFVAYYFHRFLARNPFGVDGLDLTSIYAGKVSAAIGPPWTVGELAQRLAADLPLTHNALEDAIAQSRVFEQLVAPAAASEANDFVQAAARAGVELDPAEARKWIVAASGAEREAFAQDAATGGSIDPCLQEVYLEPDAIPLFRKLVARIDPAATCAYADAMRAQARHYLHAEPNFCKASKRLYNLFRLTDELAAAAYVRELFDEPAARMYQVPGLLEAADVALGATTKIKREVIVRQLDLVIWTVVMAGGAAAADLVMELIRLRDGVLGHAASGTPWAEGLRESRARCSEMVSEYFRSRLFGLPRIAQLVAELTP